SYLFGKIDKELFNITKLVKEGYSDKEMDYIPLIMTTTDQVSMNELIQFGQLFDPLLSEQYHFSSIHGIAGKLRKDEVQSFHEALFTQHDKSFQNTEILNNIDQ